MTSRSTTLWSPRSRTLASAAMISGLACLVLGYLSADGSESLGDVIDALNLAVLGVILAGSSELLLLIVGRRQVSMLRDRVIELYAADSVDEPVLRRSDEGLVTASGSTWVHRRGCPLLTGRTTEPAAADEPLVPCAVCDPR